MASLKQSGKSVSCIEAHYSVWSMGPCFRHFRSVDWSMGPVHGSGPVRVLEKTGGQGKEVRRRMEERRALSGAK